MKWQQRQRPWVEFKATFAIWNRSNPHISENVAYVIITACTVVQAVVKATSQSNGNGQILTHPGLRNPWTDFDETWNI